MANGCIEKEVETDQKLELGPGSSRAAAEMVASPEPTQPTARDSAMDDTSLIGWGRTTRGGRRPRCLPGSVSAPLT